MLLKTNDHNHNSHQDSGMIYTCPMHPEIRQDKPGMCPECGMNLVPVKKNDMEHYMRGKSLDASQDKHAGHKTESFLRKFWIVLALTIPILIYSELPEKVFTWSAPKFPGSDFLILALASIVFFYGGSIFLTSAWRELKARLPGMMTLIALAICAAYFLVSFQF
ncbi:MAG: Copper-exporting ATPase [Parcubacteria group bacterium GW2011_GWA2_40_8]|nr:MAG: Copper-exporting ATPase [Parcubacteria group bacterium GW2011_GWA2_40_8]